MKYFSYFLSAAFICAIPLIGFSQIEIDTAKGKMTAGGGGGLTIGYGYFDVSPLRAFVPDQTPSFSNGQLLIGGLGYGYIGNLVMAEME